MDTLINNNMIKILIIAFIIVLILLATAVSVMAIIFNNDESIADSD
jgi:hypothetical protein